MSYLRPWLGRYLSLQAVRILGLIVGLWWVFSGHLVSGQMRLPEYMIQSPQIDFWPEVNHQPAGPVTRMLYYKADFAMQNGRWVEGDPLPVEERSFDHFGRNTEIIAFDGDGGFMGRLEFTYDELGRVVSLRNYGLDDVVHAAFVNYDDLGTWIESVTHDQEGKVLVRTLVAATDEGFSTELELYEGDRKFESSYFHFLIDKEGRPVHALNREGDIVETWHYDNAGLIREIHDRRIGVLLKYTFSYNVRGEVIEEHTYDESGKLISGWSYEYAYDDEGNWVRNLARYTGQENVFRPVYAIYREIYYDTP